jgi:hypothetical protein
MKFLSQKTKHSYYRRPKIRADFTARYKTTAALYYKGQPPFEELLKRIELYINKL